MKTLWAYMNIDQFLWWDACGDVVRCMYKILAKILANRLELIISIIIDRKQSAFVKGRRLLVSVLVANEVTEKTRQNAKLYMCNSN